MGTGEGESQTGESEGRMTRTDKITWAVFAGQMLLLVIAVILAAVLEPLL